MSEKTRSGLEAARSGTKIAPPIAKRGSFACRIGDGHFEPWARCHPTNERGNAWLLSEDKFLETSLCDAVSKLNEYS